MNAHREAAGGWTTRRWWTVLALVPPLTAAPLPLSQQGTVSGRRAPFGPVDGTPPEQWRDLERHCRTLLNASADLAKVERWLEEEGPGSEGGGWFDGWPLAIPPERWGTVFYPSAEPEAWEAREALLTAGRRAVPVILNAILDVELGAPEEDCWSYFAQDLLAEIVCGRFRLGFGGTEQDRREHEQALRSWLAFWECAEGDRAFWDLVTSRGDLGAFEAAFPRIPGGCSLGLGDEEAPFVKTETVLQAGQTLIATTDAGILSICADGGFGRHFTWAGATRFIVMNPQNRVGDGQAGLSCPGFGDHWDEHDGITRAVLQEGRMHFESTAAALEWLNGLKGMPYAHTGDGLVVGWENYLPRRQLNVDVWQAYVRGRKPVDLPGADDEAVVVVTP